MVAKAIVVRKSSARKSVPVRVWQGPPLRPTVFHTNTVGHLNLLLIFYKILIRLIKWKDGVMAATEASKASALRA